MTDRAFPAHLRRLLHAKDGNVAIVFALCAVPLIGAVGAAVDYSHASAIRTSMQAALDATSLMLAKSAGSQSLDEMQKLGARYFKAQFKAKDAKKTTVTVIYTEGSSTVQVKGAAEIDTTFMNVLGFRNLEIGASSTSMWGAKSRLRVALVLDNTGSMGSAGKINALRTASKNLLAKLNSATVTKGDVYVSVIPFSRGVNVGSSNYTQNWVGWRYWEETNGYCSNPTYNNKTKCESQSAAWTAKNHNGWNGCITDRDQDYDTTNAAANPADASLPASTPSSLFPASQDNACPAQMLSLTDDWSSLYSAVAAMSPGGTTNQSIGLVWGWLSLTQGSVLSPPATSSGYVYAQHILLLTDGLNTENRFSKDQASIDAREKIVCDNVKAAGITLWTIQVNTDGDPTSTLLQNCASDPSKFFLLTSADQIISTFDSISFKITQLHISK